MVINETIRCCTQELYLLFSVAFLTPCDRTELISHQKVQNVLSKLNMYWVYLHVFSLFTQSDTTFLTSNWLSWTAHPLIMVMWKVAAPRETKSDFKELVVDKKGQKHENSIIPFKG